MVDIPPHRMLGTLYRNEIFVGVGTIGAGSRTHAEVVNSLVPFVLVPLDEIPSQDEMLCNVDYTLSNQSHGDIVPRHSSVVSLIQFIVGPILYGLEVHDSTTVDQLRIDVSEG